jgi:hypothetical protein
MVAITQSIRGVKFTETISRMVTSMGRGRRSEETLLSGLQVTALQDKKQFKLGLQPCDYVGGDQTAFAKKH